jgi:hypothetical protein
MLKVLSLTRIPNILPPKYELRLYDSSQDNRGYVLQNGKRNKRPDPCQASINRDAGSRDRPTLRYVG